MYPEFGLVNSTIQTIWENRTKLFSAFAGIASRIKRFGKPEQTDVKQALFNLFNPLNAELNPICYLLALLAHYFLHVSRISVKSLTLRLLMSYIYIYIYIYVYIYIYYIYMEHLFLMFLDHTQRRSTVGRTPLDE